MAFTILPPCPIHGMWVVERHLEMAKPKKSKRGSEKASITNQNSQDFMQYFNAQKRRINISESCKNLALQLITFYQDLH